MLLNLTWAQENIDQTIRTIIKIALMSSAAFYATTTLAQSISYAQAEQSVLKDSYSTQANQALQQAAKLEAEAAKGLGLPRVDLNIRAYAFHTEVDIPLDAFKNNL